MFNRYRQIQFARYNEARNQLIANPEILLNLEEFFAGYIKDLLQDSLDDIRADYDEASYLFPFWQEYPPDERGRQPRGDQYPWIEVGEHALGHKLPRLFQREFEIRDIAIPTGPDQRFLVTGDRIALVSHEFTRTAWVFVDIKSVGPRDDSDHAVMSHNQVSGNGVWIDAASGIKNSTIIATGKQQSHEFHCAVPPLYVLSNQTIAPVILIAIKPVYRMLALDNPDQAGQPLKKITIAAIPNGLLLQQSPGYLRQHPGLFYPGKDDKTTNPLKLRCRVSFALLREIAPWRVQDILV